VAVTVEEHARLAVGGDESVRQVVLHRPQRRRHEALVSILCSQFSASFANFRRKICSFSQKSILQLFVFVKTSSSSEQKTPIFPLNFSCRNILKS
jgi:hypothetical protein